MVLSTSPFKLIAIALSVYAAWVAATYFLEVSINLLLRVDPVGRITYVAIANIAIGTIVSGLALRHLLKSRFVKAGQIGADKPASRIAIAMSAAIAGGLALFLLQNPLTVEPVIVFNAFMQVLPVSIAEVMVCWALVGSSFEALDRRRGRIASILAGAVTASVLFGVYHYAHSPPFNGTGMVLFLMLPSIATVAAYFVLRNIYAAVIVQNFMGIVGVMAGLPDLEPYRQPMIPIYAMSAASVAALVIMSAMLKRSAKKIEHDEAVLVETESQPDQS
jgi:hypothetical protein